MTLPLIDTGFLAQTMEPTWPPAATRALGPFRLRDGGGGGKRVSAATAHGPWTEADLDAAEAAMTQPIFCIRAGDEALDAALAARGYAIVDPVVIYRAPAADLATEVPPLSVLPHWPPLAITREVWADGEIGRGRLRVMERASGPKTALLGREGDLPGGAAFVALAGKVAMLHALHVAPAVRRRGLGARLVQGAANWALEAGATEFALVVTERNLAARALYDRLGMDCTGMYHYRVKGDAPRSFPPPDPHQPETSP